MTIDPVYVVTFCLLVSVIGISIRIIYDYVTKRYPLTIFERYLYTAVLCLLPEVNIISDDINDEFLSRVKKSRRYFNKTTTHLRELGLDNDNSHFEEYYKSLQSVISSNKLDSVDDNDLRKKATKIFYQFIDSKEVYKRGYIRTEYRLKFPKGFLEEVRKSEEKYRGVI